MVQLTAPTIEILKNLATINQTLLLPENSEVLYTRSVKKNTYAEVVIPERFPRRGNGSEICIYDLNQFLSVVDQFDKPTLDFDASEAYMVINEGTGGLSVKYHYGDEELAYKPDPRKKIELPSTEVEFKLTEATYKSVNSMARTLGTPYLALESDGETLRLVTSDPANTSTNTVSLDIGESPTDAVFSFVWKFDYLKLIAGTYQVAVSKKGLSRFKHESLPVTYHVLIEANSSKYEG